MPAAEDTERPRRWAAVAIGLLVVLPVLVLIVALARRTWYPTGDQAQAELRMRSLPGHPPLVGAAGRIVDAQGRQGNHPGPLMFWVTWPVYALLGRSAWAFEAATALVNAAWLAVAVWLARRRGGVAVAWWAGVVLLVLVGGYGLSAMSQPWNPWVALLPFSVLLFAVWSVLDGDRWMLPLAVAAGSYSLQGHAGYALLVPVLLIAAAAGSVWPAWRARREHARAPAPAPAPATAPAGTGSGPGGAGDQDSARLAGAAGTGSGPGGAGDQDSARLAGAVGTGSGPGGAGDQDSARLAGAAGTGSGPGGAGDQDSARLAWGVVGPIVLAILLGLLLWSGPIVDVFVHHPSNVDKLLANFGHPDKAPIGVGRAVRAVLQSADPTGVWVTGGDAVRGSAVLGSILLAAWAATAVVAWRRGARSLTRFNLVLAGALVLGTYSVSRIFGDFYLYVFRWICALTAGVVFGLGWALVTILPRPRLDATMRRRAAALGTVVLVGLAALTTVRLVRAPLPYDYTGRLERSLAPATVGRLDRRRRYLITWDDPAYLGGLGFGLLLDLERRGFTVGTEARFSTGVEPRRVRCPGSYDAVLTVVTSASHLATWRAKPGVREIAAADIRTADQRAAYDRDFRALQAALARHGVHDDAAQLDGVINFLLLDSSQPKEISRLAARLVVTGVPSAVFLADPAPDPGPVPHDPLDEPCWKR